jgi:nucleoside-diphosphate-sugar epimerase
MLAAERSVRPVVIHAGSCFEYADAGRDDLSEDCPTHPFSLYGATKSASVHLAVGLAIELQLRLVVLRLFGVYGASESAERFVPTVIRNLSAGQAMALTPGTQQRDLMLVDDMAQAFVAALANLESLENLGIYNICTGRATTIRQVGDTLAQEMGCPASLLEWGALPPRPGEPDRIVGDGSRFQIATGWRPQHDLRSGLRRTIQALATQTPALRRSA